MSDAVATALAAERALLDPVVRGDRSAVEALLTDDFREFGASGRVWSRETAIEALVADPALAGEPHELAGVALADGLVLVTYWLVEADRETLRSSLWRYDGERWRLVFHQGTPVAGS